MCESGLALIHALAAGTSSSTVGSDLVDQADFLGLGRVEPGALAQDLHERLLDAEHPHGAGHAAATGQQAQRDLGQADDAALDVSGDAVVTRQRDLQTTAERGAVDGGDDRLAEGLQPAQVALDGLDRAEDVAGVLRPALIIALRSPPAKKVFFALVTTTPVIESFSATSRSTALCIDSL